MRTTSRWLMPILAAVLFFGAIGVAQAAGWWVTSGREAVPAGEMTTADLKGWMTLEEAADGLGVPVGDLVALVGAPAGSGVSAATAFKDIEGLVLGFELTAYREAVQAYLDQRAGKTPVPSATALPLAASTGTPAPSVPAVAPTTHVPIGTPTGTATGTPTGTPTSSIRGSMTLLEVAEVNDVALDRLLAEAGLPADLDPETVLREIQNTVPGFEIETLREAVAALSG